jgi:hypothetical protein
MIDLVGGTNAILLLLTAMTVGGALLIAIISWRHHNPRVARTFAGGAALVGVAYLAGVLVASAGSQEQTIAQGDTKWFCGFYLDCHLGMSVEGADRVTSIPSASGTLNARGSFHIITVKLENSAKNPNVDMLLYRPVAKVVDASGNEYTRSAAAEAALGTSRAPVLGAETKVKHEPVMATMVFDLPANIQQPRLLVSEGWIVDRIIELGLIDDENSIFHKRELFAIDGNTRTASRQEE